MAEVVLSTSNGMSYNYPHTEMRTVISGAVDTPAAVSGDAGVLFAPIFMPKGRTNKFLQFSGANAYAKYIKEFGYANMLKNGLSSCAMEKHLYNGGRGVAINVRPEDAGLAHAICVLQVAPKDVEFWVVKGSPTGNLYGNIYKDEPTDIPAADKEKITIHSYSFAPVFQYLSGAGNLNNLGSDALSQINMYAKTALMTIEDTDTIKKLPLYTFSYPGLGRYGNNYKGMIEPTLASIDAHRLYDVSVTDVATSEILESYKCTHARNVYSDGVPMSTDDVFATESNNMNVYYFTDEVDAFDAVMKKMLTSIKDQLDTLIVGTQGAGISKPWLQKTSDYLRYIINAIDLKEFSYPALDLLEVFGQPLASKNETFRSLFHYGIEDLPVGSKKYEFRLMNGTDGCLTNMTRFDFAYEYLDKAGVVKATTNISLTAPGASIEGMVLASGDVIELVGQTNAAENGSYTWTGPAVALTPYAGVTKTPVTDLFVKVFNGDFGGEIYDAADVNADYILDFAYPSAVKEILQQYSLRRPDIPVIPVVNPALTSTFNNMKTAVKALNGYFYDNVNVTMFGNSYEEYFNREKRPYRVPITYALIPVLTKFYKNGMRGAIAGQFLTGVEEGSVLPKINLPEQKSWCFENNVNYITNTKSGWMIDGQAGNMVGKEHPYKELHNQLIVGRIMKDIIDFLVTRRHMLDDGTLLATLNREMNELVLSKYKAVIDVSYRVFYKDSYAQKVGTLTDEFTINGTRTVKRHDVLINLVNN